MMELLKQTIGTDGRAVVRISSKGASIVYLTADCEEVQRRVLEKPMTVYPEQPAKVAKTDRPLILRHFTSVQ